VVAMFVAGGFLGIAAGFVIGAVVFAFDEE
jgi:hypothetical protein